MLDIATARIIAIEGAAHDVSPHGSDKPQQCIETAVNEMALLTHGVLPSGLDSRRFG
jgi:hypothetical protein